LGPPVTLHELLLAPPHSLRRQAHAPRCQIEGRINADGFGVAWYAPEVRAEPARYRRPVPMWTDRSFDSLAGVVSSGAVLASVRNASPGLAIDESNTAPYVSGAWAFAHNGYVPGFRDAAGSGETLRALLHPRRAGGIEGGTDSETLFALLLQYLDDGARPDEAVAATVAAGFTAAPHSRLNLLLTDGAGIWATAAGDTLYVRRAPATVVVASEPYDDEPGWEPVPDGSLVSATTDHCTIGALS
jgi:glutamine amidotransferase